MTHVYYNPLLPFFQRLTCKVVEEQLTFEELSYEIQTSVRGSTSREDHKWAYIREGCVMVPTRHTSCRMTSSPLCREDSNPSCDDEDRETSERDLLRTSVRYSCESVTHTSPGVTVFALRRLVVSHSLSLHRCWCTHSVLWLRDQCRLRTPLTPGSSVELTLDYSLGLGLGRSDTTRV